LLYVRSEQDLNDQFIVQFMPRTFMSNFLGRIRMTSSISKLRISEKKFFIRKTFCTTKISNDLESNYLTTFFVISSNSWIKMRTSMKSVLYHGKMPYNRLVNPFKRSYIYHMRRVTMFGVFHNMHTYS
jgi:hypothetical protein